MREILFRGKQFDNGDWMYGSLILTKISSMIGALDGHVRFVDPETVGQYTGLTDKKGRKIFEGDIVDMPGYNGTRHRAKVYFRDGKFAVDGVIYEFKDIKPRTMEIVGNIFDNPEPMETRS